jgi:Na+-translocating ferredoxin:NAD+ oxidoreductase RNF subunit RnfB
MDTSVFLTPAAMLGGVGFAFGALIAVAHRKLRVFEDPRIAAVTELLPGTNCGACGQAGCGAFAAALVAGRLQPARCTVMGADDVQRVAAFLGVEAGRAERRIARLLCAGGSDVAVQTADYRGLGSCAAAAQAGGGGKGCAWGCLGLADCAEACDFGAIVMTPNHLPAVIPERCTACGDCVEACPRDLFTLLPLEHRLLVQCRSLLAGDAAEALCRVACNGCGRCAADAAPGLIGMVEGLAVIDTAKIDAARPEAARRCPTGAIVWLEGAQFGPFPGAAADAGREIATRSATP